MDHGGIGHLAAWDQAQRHRCHDAVVRVAERPAIDRATQATNDIGTGAVVPQIGGAIPQQGQRFAVFVEPFVFGHRDRLRQDHFRLGWEATATGMTTWRTGLRGGSGSSRHGRLSGSGSGSSGRPSGQVPSVAGILVGESGIRSDCRCHRWAIARQITNGEFQLDTLLARMMPL